MNKIQDKKLCEMLRSSKKWRYQAKIPILDEEKI